MVQPGTLGPTVAPADRAIQGTSLPPLLGCWSLGLLLLRTAVDLVLVMVAVDDELRLLSCLRLESRSSFRKAFFNDGTTQNGTRLPIQGSRFAPLC